MKDINGHTAATVLSFLSISYYDRLGRVTVERIYRRLVDFLEDDKQKSNHHYICKLSETAMRVAASQNNEIHAKRT